MRVNYGKTDIKMLLLPYSESSIVIISTSTSSFYFLLDIYWEQTIRHDNRPGSNCFSDLQDATVHIYH